MIMTLSITSVICDYLHKNQLFPISEADGKTSAAASKKESTISAKEPRIKATSTNDLKRDVDDVDQ